MSINPNVARVASSIADISRAGILTVLLDGRYHTATELSSKIGITPQTISYHLNKLLEQELITVEKQGRHRYFGIPNQEIAATLESLLVISPQSAIKSFKQSRDDSAIRQARTCYDHIAGDLGVKITNALLEKGILCDHQNEFSLTKEGELFFEDFQINISETRKKRRSFCHKCLDWSERRHHLGGALGNAILERLIELHWVTRMPDTRALSVTMKGKAGLKDVFSIQIDQ